MYACARTMHQGEGKSSNVCSLKATIMPLRTRNFGLDPEGNVSSELEALHSESFTKDQPSAQRQVQPKTTRRRKSEKRAERDKERVSMDLTATIRKLRQIQIAQEKDAGVPSSVESGDSVENMQNTKSLEKHGSFSKPKQQTRNGEGGSRNFARHRFPVSVLKTSPVEMYSLPPMPPLIGVTCSSPTRNEECGSWSWPLSNSLSPASLSGSATPVSPISPGIVDRSNSRSESDDGHISLPPLKGTPKLGHKKLPPISPWTTATLPLLQHTTPAGSNWTNRAVVPPIPVTAQHNTDGLNSSVLLRGRGLSSSVLPLKTIGQNIHVDTDVKSTEKEEKPLLRRRGPRRVPTNTNSRRSSSLGRPTSSKQRAWLT